MSRRKINRGYKRKEELAESAAEMAEVRAARSPKQQIEELDRRLGPGVGAKKERSRLLETIDLTMEAQKVAKKHKEKGKRA